ncbi:DUF3102 domain-containing protein [Oscillospiraceae bacterium 38-13]
MGDYNLAEVLRGQLQGQADPAETARDIEAVTCEILHLKQELARNIVGIGLRLIEAKAMLSHGEWLPWLKDNVCFSETTAQSYMKVAKEFPNPQLVGDLGVRKALTLLALPSDEREAFVEQHNVIDMTSRELEKAIRERDEALIAAEAAKADAQSAEESRAKMEADMKALAEIHRSAQEGEALARDALERAQAELKELRERPVDVAVEVDQKAVDAARAEAIAEMRAKVGQAEAARKEAEKKRKEAEKALGEARKQAGANAAILSRAEKAEAELAEARRQLEIAAQSGAQSAISSDGDLASFKLLLDQSVAILNQMLGLHMKIQGRDAASGEKCRRALIAYFEEGRKRV